jgi:5-methylthioadenosine/S-adenosylhomocysteine deaminase
MSRTRFDTAIVGATLLTGDATRPVVRQGVLGILENRIAFAGARGELPAEIPAARVIEAEGRVVTAGFINVHTHAVLSLMRGIALDMGFAPAYTRGVPHGHDITEDEAVALARLGALEALTFGSTTMVDSYVHASRCRRWPSSVCVCGRARAFMTSTSRACMKASGATTRRSARAASWRRSP